jgi:hypothetical protein
LNDFSVIKTFSNLASIAEDEDTYISANDPDYDDLTEAISDLGMDDDEYSFDTVTVGFRSAYEKNKQTFLSPKKGQKKVYGNTTLNLPYILDTWRDAKSQARVSIQVQMLSGPEFFAGVGVRVSTNKMKLVLTWSMSPFMARAENAVTCSFLDGQNFSESEKSCMNVIMKHHGKTVSWCQCPRSRSGILLKASCMSSALASHVRASTTLLATRMVTNFFMGKNLFSTRMGQCTCMWNFSVSHLMGTILRK